MENDLWEEAKKLKKYWDERDKILTKALAFATEKHKGQIRFNSREPYINHPIAVAQIVSEYPHNNEMLVAAYLHDTIEDTNTTYEEIEKEFGKKVADLVLELTNDEAQMNAKGKAEYLLDKMNRMSTEALTIKLADRLHNVSDFDTAKPKWRTKYKLQTETILNGLKNLNATQQKLVKDIHNIIDKY
jgi:(p)ppGpp synthase/HD superfamily hydrolase